LLPSEEDFAKIRRVVADAIQPYEETSRLAVELRKGDRRHPGAFDFKRLSDRRRGGDRRSILP